MKKNIPVAQTTTRVVWARFAFDHGVHRHHRQPTPTTPYEQWLAGAFVWHPLSGSCRVSFWWSLALEWDPLPPYEQRLAAVGEAGGRRYRLGATS
jgi:hypothetical protein